jgi:GT2 family glycosyltransferase
MNTAPRLSVVLGTYNRLESLKRCLESIQAQTSTPHVIHVTDAGSTDGTQKYLRSVASDTIRPWLVGRKLGQAKALNDVFRTIDTPYVCWLSDDNEIVNRGLDAGIHILERWREVGMVALKVKDVQGPFVDAPYIGGISSIGILNVNQGLLPTHVLRQVGHFSETFGFYGIDPDLTAQVLYAGYDIVYTREVAIHHYRDWAMDPNTKAGAELKAHHEKSLRLYERKYGALTGQDRFLAWKKRLWLRLAARLKERLGVNSHDPWMGALPRDWFNALHSRYIHPLDPWLTHGRPFHLRQHIPAHELPPSPPTDDGLLDED